MSKITVVEANYSDKETVKLLFTKGQKGDKGDKGEKGQDGANSKTSELINDSGFITLEDVEDEGYAKDTDVTSALNNFKNTLFPIGSVYFTATNTNPNTFLGGTWEQIAQGQFVVGVGTGTDANDVVRTFIEGENVGEYEHVQTDEELATHNHTITDEGHTHNVTYKDGTQSGSVSPARTVFTESGSSLTKATATATTGIAINDKGESQAMNIVNPSFGMYIWQRTA